MIFDLKIFDNIRMYDFHPVLSLSYSSLSLIFAHVNKSSSLKLESFPADEGVAALSQDDKDFSALLFLLSALLAPHSI